jgi:predicted RNase H-like nuclease
VLAAASWEEACAIREQLEGKRMNKQSWNITAKVREVDALLQARPELRGWLREVHPELSFSTLAGAPLPEPKKTATGKQLRQELIAATFGAGAYEAVRAQFRRTAVVDDDILDAFAALWSAERLLNSQATVLPAAPELDTTGLAMEIVV